MPTDGTKKSNETTLKTACQMCIEECGITAHIVDGKLVKTSGLREHPFSEGFTCVKGRSIPQYVYSEKRIQHPMKKVDGEWQRITWDEALDTIVEKLKHYQATDGPQAVAFMTGDPVNMILRMGYYLIWRFADIYRTPNRFYDGDICFTPRIRAYFALIGKMIIPDPINSKFIINWGGNPEAAFPPLYNRMLKGVKKNGAKLVVIDPREIPMVRKADLFLQPRPGTDCMLGLAMLNVIINEGLYDREFVENSVIGFDELAEHVRPFTPEVAEEITWVPADKIREVARAYATTKPACIVGGMKLEQTASGWGISLCLVMLQILTGNIDVLGGGLIRMAGIKEHPYRLRQFMGDLKCTGAETHPLLHESGMVFHEGGMANWTDTILEGEPYQVKMVMINGSNPVVSWPNTRKTMKALDQLEFLVVMDPFWTPTCEHAHIVLPACTFAERISLCTIYQGMNVPAVQMRRRAIEPLHEARSDATVWLELAKRMGGDFAKHIPWTDDEELFDYWLEPSGLTAKALKEHPTGIVTGSDEIRFDYHKHGFATKSGKAELYSQELLRLGVEPLPIYREPAESPISTPELAKEYPVILTTGAREIEFWHSQQRHVPNLTKRNPEPRVEMHKDTAAQYGIADGDMVFIETRRGRAEMKAKVTDKILAGVVSTSHGWAGKGNENLLTNDVPEDPVGGLPPMAAHLCKIGKIG